MLVLFSLVLKRILLKMVIPYTQHAEQGRECWYQHCRYLLLLVRGEVGGRGQAVPGVDHPERRGQ